MPEVYTAFENEDFFSFGHGNCQFTFNFNILNKFAI